MKNKYSEKEKFKILKELKESNLSVNKFAREKCVPASTVFTWLKKEKKSEQINENALSNKNENEFVEIEVPKENQRNNGEKNTKHTSTLVLACNGCAVQIFDDFNQTTLRRILQVVQEL